MTLPPYNDSAPEWEAYRPAAVPWVPAEAPVESPAGARRSRRLGVAATVTGVLVLGGAGLAVAAYLDGSGPQPQDVLPADTLGFVSLDLDPSLGQKAALMSLLGKFPGLETEQNGDLRAELLDQLVDASETGLNYATDVQPWAGDRMAVALVPVEESDEGLAPVVALAVTDGGLMADSLTSAQEDSDFGFAVRGDYVLLTGQPGAGRRHRRRRGDAR